MFTSQCRSIVLFTVLSGCISLCEIPASASQQQEATAVNLAKLAAKLDAAHRASVNILQLGDSHTAADWLSGELRHLFQMQYGEGGIGFIAATPIPGTRYDQVVLSTDTDQWRLVSSRNQFSDEFPLGGYLSLPRVVNAQVKIDVREPRESRYCVSALYRSDFDSNLIADDGAHRSQVPLPSTSGQWRFSSTLKDLNLPLNLTITANRGVALGGWNIESQQPTGVTYSALGVNGATLKIVDAWQAGWPQTLQALHPDLLVLAYGGNEAFDDNLDLALYQADLREKLTLLQRTLPDTLILLIGPADSIKQRSGLTCKERQPKNLSQVIEIQKQVALQSGALFWDWRAYMGGACSIEAWRSDDLAQNDLIHLNEQGYRKSAGELYRYLQTRLADK
ncbi:hypothetical protein C9383_21945 [Pseudomonas palleroniana]|uniref:Lysophospholipase L1 n=1 Tax=Pseudomonas palleroniana TaxID=191390 RepID=A0A1H5L958_9PSED|nr:MULTISPECIES: SGNH/GDSL hydrolase family protein [Pseudomonas]KAB0566802.1 hypothetical protein F7R03_14610 [Pseudomonas palleroniana]KWU51713.1 hypothetical protein AWV77_06670 [Pseudomonas palleroniana]NCE84954.1 hypothetical protein [Pseudomonas sp. Q1]PTC22836.1 hypothetical protein C9383_21945 [Pseudomonas palleroniana]UOK39006.1 SGNH/GDSL hydrolase family protein [Pseudomonas palleroniana]